LQKIHSLAAKKSQSGKYNNIMRHDYDRQIVIKHFKQQSTSGIITLVNIGTVCRPVEFIWGTADHGPRRLADPISLPPNAKKQGYSWY